MRNNKIDRKHKKIRKIWIEFKKQRTINIVHITKTKIINGLLLSDDGLKWMDKENLLDVISIIEILCESDQIDDYIGYHIRSISDKEYQQLPHTHKYYFYHPSSDAAIVSPLYLAQRRWVLSQRFYYLLKIGKKRITHTTSVYPYNQEYCNQRDIISKRNLMPTIGKIVGFKVNRIDYYEETKKVVSEKEYIKEYKQEIEHYKLGIHQNTIIE